MIKVLIGALFMATSALAQSASPPNQAGSAERPSGSTESRVTPKPKAKAASNRPLPQPSMKEKLESGDRAIPSYKEEKDAGIHKGRAKYPAKQTTSGAPKKTS